MVLLLALVLVEEEERMPVSTCAVAFVEALLALMLLPVVVLPMVLLEMVFVPLVVHIPLKECDMDAVEPKSVIEPIVLLEIAVVLEPAEPIPTLAPPVVEIEQDTEPVPVPLPMVFPVVVPIFVKPAAL
jgi:hypothetical protein